MDYTCTDYRLEMQLLALQRQLTNETLSHDQIKALKDQIQNLEQQLGMGNDHSNE